MRWWVGMLMGRKIKEQPLLRGQSAGEYILLSSTNHEDFRSIYFSKDMNIKVTLGMCTTPVHRIGLAKTASDFLPAQVYHE